MDGIWLPILLLWAEGNRGGPNILRYEDLFLCELHKRVAVLEDFLPDADHPDGWELLCEISKSRGYPPPERRLTMLEFERIES